jgi:hypothetical protein
MRIVLFEGSKAEGRFDRSGLSKRFEYNLHDANAKIQKIHACN